MEGDLIRTIQQNIQWLGHFHTGGVPGRHELRQHAGSSLDAVMRGNRCKEFHGTSRTNLFPRAIHSLRYEKRSNCAMYSLNRLR